MLLKIGLTRLSEKRNNGGSANHRGRLRAIAPTYLVAIRTVNETTPVRRERRGVAGELRDRPRAGVAVFRAAFFRRLPASQLAADFLVRRTRSVL